MDSWLDLEKRFRELIQPLKGLRLDHQWGDAGEYWNLAGARNSYYEQFQILASIASQLLEKSLEENDLVLQKILSENSRNRWFRAVWELTNKKENFLMGIMKDNDGNHSGHIYSSSIFNVVDVSANLCLKLHATYPIQTDNLKTKSEIHITDSTIGFINTGEMEEFDNISVNITNLQSRGYEELAIAIKKLVDGIGKSPNLDVSSKQEVIEQLDELTKQALQVPEKRLKPSVIKTITTSLEKSLSVASDLAQIWSVWGPIIITFFK